MHVPPLPPTQEVARLPHRDERESPATEVKNLDISSEAMAAIISTMIGTVATFGAVMLSQHYKRQLLHVVARQDLIEARSHLVNELFLVAHGRGDADELGSLYRQLLIVAEKNCQLGVRHCLLEAVYAFKSQVIKPYQQGKLAGNGMAQRVRVTADAFNRALNDSFPSSHTIRLR